MVASLVTNGSVLGFYVTRGAGEPTIATVPASQTVLQNRPASMSVTLTECTDFASYQWVFNKTNLIPDATNATYSIALAQASDAGQYEVIVGNIIGSVTSTPPAVLTVAGDTISRLMPLSAVRPYGQTTNVIVVLDELLYPQPAPKRRPITTSPISPAA